MDSSYNFHTAKGPTGFTATLKDMYSFILIDATIKMTSLKHTRTANEKGLDMQLGSALTRVSRSCITWKSHERWR